MQKMESWKGIFFWQTTRRKKQTTDNKSGRFVRKHFKLEGHLKQKNNLKKLQLKDVIGPRPSLLFRGIPFDFGFEIFVERNVRRTRNSRKTAVNHSPYFEALKKMQALCKSTENHILACLLHLQLHAPLFRFEKHLHLTWFWLFLLLSFFTADFVLGNDTCAFWKCMCAPRGM